MVQVRVFPTGRPGMQGRSYLLLCAGQACAVDPDGNAQALLAALDEANATLRYILLTHGHFDHTGDMDALHAATGAPVLLGAADAPLLQDGFLNGSALFFGPAGAEVHGSAQQLLVGSEVLPLGEARVEVLAAPGHTRGGLCYRCADLLFTGDTLMRAALGRVDLPHAAPQQYADTLRRLFTLPGHLQVLPGHGAPTTLGAEAARYQLEVEEEPI